VEDYLWTVGQEIACLGAPDGSPGVDPRYDATGQVHRELRDLQRAFKSGDPPPERVKPVPMQLVAHAVAQAQQGTEFDRACADLLIIGIYYLLCPGEHTHTSNSDDNHPFCLQDVSFVAHNATHNAATASTTSLQAATVVHLNFTPRRMAKPMRHSPMGIPTILYFRHSKLCIDMSNTYTKHVHHPTHPCIWFTPNLPYAKLPAIISLPCYDAVYMPLERT
jgi:hypothetical protein